MVLDASIAIDWLLDLPRARFILTKAGHVRLFAAPHLLDAEVGQVLRRFVWSGKLRKSRAEMALADLQHLPVRRYEHAPLLRRAWQLRDNCTFYDALYLALAESLSVSLLTGDAALNKVQGLKQKVIVI